MAKNISISADFFPQILRTAIFMITLGLVVFAFPANRYVKHRVSPVWFNLSPEWSCSLLKQIAANLKFCGDSFLSTGIHTFIYNWLLDIYPRSFTGTFSCYSISYTVVIQFFILFRLFADSRKNIRFFCCCSLGDKINQIKNSPWSLSRKRAEKWC